jgi:polar amino acid transport system substrate-binding protein
MKRTTTTAFGARLTCALGGVTALLALTACGPSLEEETSSTAAVPEADESLSELVPAAIRDKGSITVAAAVYAPAVMMPPGGNGEPTGWDIEVTRQAAALLGLDVKFTVIPFDGVVPGLQAGRYDAAAGEIYVTPERTEVVTFVVNHVSKDEFLVPADFELDTVASVDDICGNILAAQLGSAEADFANEMKAECDASGAASTEVKTFSDQATVNLALSQGRVDVVVASGSQAAYAAEQSKGKFKVATMEFGDEIQTGLALARNDNTDQLAEAFEAATNQMIEDGSLQAILDETNGGLGAVEKSEIVPAPSS